ncbi:MAG: response regulator [Phycisphaerales bacterium]
MTAIRPRLVLIAESAQGSGAIDASTLDVLRDRFEIVEAGDVATALRLAAETPGSVIFGSAGRVIGGAGSLQRAGAVVESIGQGVGLVHESGEVLWMNAALGGRDPETLRRYADACVEAIRAFNAHPPGRGHPATRRVTFRSGGVWYEQVISPAPGSGAATGGEALPAGRAAGRTEHVDGAVGVLWDITASRRLQERIEAVESAGEELLRLDPQTIAATNIAERLRTIERSAIHALQSVLGFEAFEVRLLDRRSGKLELVFNVGIRPLGIGESLFATPTGNGISGHVATSGRSYICGDVARDPLYRAGLESARSSLTVPLLLLERVVGVMNVESAEAERFDDEDRLLAELYGRYVAQALNVFELLLSERTTTRENFATTLGGEIKLPLEEAGAHTEALRQLVGDDPRARARIDQIVESIAMVRARMEACSAGPQTLLGVEEALASGGVDPLIAGRRVLVADDEPLIRQTIFAVLAKRGAEVTICRDGATAIEQIRAAVAAGRPFELVVSDVRMPDRNGYEVFRAVKEANAGTPVILMTGFGYDPHHSIVRSSQEGLHCFLFKPFQVAQLMDEVRKALTNA